MALALTDGVDRSAGFKGVDPATFRQELVERFRQKLDEYKSVEDLLRTGYGRACFDLRLRKWHITGCEVALRITEELDRQP